jgi:uncharacterized membrane protein
LTAVASRRREIEFARLHRRLEAGDPFWPAQSAVVLAVLLSLTLPDKLRLGPRPVLPAVEAALLLVLVFVLPRRATRHDHRRRRFALTVIGLVSLTTVLSLAKLVHYLVAGGQVGGERLIESGAVLWLTLVLLFAVWYWELDGGGPVARMLHPTPCPDFLFPQIDNPQHAPKNWRPGFVDYLYLSLTNSMAFSPTDTMPLTGTAKVLMGLQSVTALMTIGLVVARAVNILG